MTTTLEVPLRQEPDGTLRVGRTRVTLDTVVATFKEGATPEAIVERFPTLALADVYAAVTYYLLNRDAVERYLQEREREASALRRKIEAQLGTRQLRERLRARRNALVHHRTDRVAGPTANT